MHLGIAALPFVAVMTLAVLSLANAPPAHWGTMLTGHMWLECLISIPVIAVVPFASLMWVVERSVRRRISFGPGPWSVSRQEA